MQFHYGDIVFPYEHFILQNTCIHNNEYLLVAQLHRKFHREFDILYNGHPNLGFFSCILRVPV